VGDLILAFGTPGFRGEIPPEASAAAFVFLVVLGVVLLVAHRRGWL